MEEPKRDAVPGTPEIFTPVLPEKPPFAASKTEKILAFAMLAAAYFYVWIFLGDQARSAQLYAALLATFAAAFVAMGFLLRPRGRLPWESWVWLGCLAVILAAKIAGRGAVWGDVWPVFFVHVFAVYWYLSASGRLLEGRSGHLLPLDALNGFVAFPFGHFFLRARTIGLSLRGSPEKKRAAPDAVLLSVAAAAAAALLLYLAANLLSAADDTFGGIFQTALDWLHERLNWDVPLRFLLSLPVGAYLFGLLAGAPREPQAALRGRAARTAGSLEKLRRVPNALWTAALAVFAALYLLFFVIQGTYLFGAFARRLPEGFTVAQYARQGFFELCRVMALNLALLWLVTRLGSRPARTSPGLRALVTVLLAESMLLAVVALSKLGLYISCFGFTPLRLQSTWLACVLLAACAAALVSLWTGRRTMRAWMIFGAVTLAALHLV